MAEPGTDLGGWIDVSVPVSAGLVTWPGDPSPQFEKLADLADGDSCSVTGFSMSAHAGTHVDAPCHYLEGGSGVDKAPLEAFIGPARVIAIEDRARIDADAVRSHEPRAGERLILRTDNSRQSWHGRPFHPDYAHLTSSAATLLAECGVRTVGIDYLSIGAFQEDGEETHTILLSAGIWIIEGLNLQHIGAGSYDLLCLPLALVGADGAPARALLRPLGSHDHARVGDK